MISGKIADRVITKVTLGMKSERAKVYQRLKDKVESAISVIKVQCCQIENLQTKLTSEKAESSRGWHVNSSLVACSSLSAKTATPWGDPTS